LINIGFCGSSTTHYKLGSLLLIDKITDMDTNTDYYPDVFIGQDLPREALSCYSRPVLRESFNCETAVFCDMESAGIIEVAKKFTYAHQVAIVKIISDYLTHYIGREKIFSI
jgi:nucleoside phosphorylase